MSALAMGPGNWIEVDSNGCFRGEVFFHQPGKETPFCYMLVGLKVTHHYFIFKPGKPTTTWWFLLDNFIKAYYKKMVAAS